MWTPGLTLGPCVAGPTPELASLPSPSSMHPQSPAELPASGGFSLSRDYGSEGKCLWGGFNTNMGMHLKIEHSKRNSQTTDFKCAARSDSCEIRALAMDLAGAA